MTGAKAIGIVGQGIINAGSGVAKSAIDGKSITTNSVVKNFVIGTIGEGAAQFGKRVAQTTIKAKSLRKAAKTLTNIANKGRQRLAQTQRAATAVAAAESYGAGNVAKTLQGVGTEITEQVVNSTTQGSNQITNSTQTNHSYSTSTTGVTSPDRTRTSITYNPYVK